jgi:hypothetical protein
MTGGRLLEGSGRLTEAQPLASPRTQFTIAYDYYCFITASEC